MGLKAVANSGSGGGTPGGSSGQVQYNNGGNFGGISGATTDGTNLTLIAQSPTTIPLVSQGAASQTANGYQYNNSSGVALSAITAAGYTLITAPASANRDISQQILATDGVAGQVRFEMAYDTGATRVRLTSPDGSTQFKLEQSNGGTTFTAVNYAFNATSGNSGFIYTGGFEALTDGSTWYLRGGTDTVRLVAQGVAGQTKNLFEARDSTGVVLASVAANGHFVKRVVTAADATSITPDTDNADIIYQSNSQAAGTLTINADTGTPTEGQSLALKLKCTNAQTFSWNAVYTGGTTALPTATTGSSKTDYFTFIYDSVASKWHFTGQALGF
jgi:hypothetical protein